MKNAKKLLACALCAAFCGAAVAGFAACNGDEDPLPDLQVYAPDGAPALALAYAVSEEEAKKEDAFDFDVVDASTIQGYVTGAAPKADLAVLPVNLAAKALGKGTTYRMLGTVTNGNLYFLTTGDNPALTAENLKTTLVGKKVGVVQLQNVPGLTLQAVLKDKEIAYQTIESADAAAAADKVNLVAFAPDDVTPAGGCDYYLCPEPAASAKIKGTAGKPNAFSDGGDLQELYGGEGGYPQAVVVAKTTVLENRKEDVETFLGYLKGAPEFLTNATVENVLKLLADVREDGLTPSFSDKNLTKEVIARCGIGFTSAKDGKEKVNAFLEKLIAVKADAAAMPDDGFFYMG